MAGPRVGVVPGASLWSQRWWPSLHATILTAYRQKDTYAFPASWTRLSPEPEVAAVELATELGPTGRVAVILQESVPVACAGLLPFRGETWVIEAQNTDSSADVANSEVTTPILHPQSASTDDVIKDWEVCCFCVHPEHRRQGLSRLLVDTLIGIIKPKGAERLIANYSLEETGQYWPGMGFTIPVGTGTMLRKGFTRVPGEEGLRDDLHFRKSARIL